MGLGDADRNTRSSLRYAEKVLDSYFGNIFVTWRNERIFTSTPAWRPQCA